MKNLFALLLCLCTALSLFAQAPNANYDPDWDGDGNLGVSDLLGFLGLFGDFDTDGDGVWDSVDDCTDLSACNFNSNPSVPCSYDDAIGVCGGWCDSDENEDGICDFTCGLDSIEYHGYSYATVQIGEQCWFSENLGAFQFNNGDSIPLVNLELEWVESTGPGVCMLHQLWSNYDLFGLLYKGHVITDERNVCPAGWHVSTDADWMELELYLGMAEGDLLASGFYSWRGVQDSVGYKLKSDNLWNGNDEFGFNGAPGRGRLDSGPFISHSAGVYTAGGTFWAKGDEDEYFKRYLAGQELGILRDLTGAGHGHSIRCIKD